MIVNYSAALVPEEEGFDFAQYKGGTRWYPLDRYTRTLETWDLQNGPWIDA